MKKLIKGVLFLAIVGTVFVGCEKEENSYSTVKDERFSPDKIDVNNNKSGGDITYISEANFEEEFETFSEAFFSVYSNGLIEIEYLSNTAQYALTTNDVGPIDPFTNERVICRGSDQGTVVNCAQNYVRFSIEGCPVEVSNASGTWVASTQC